MLARRQLTRQQLQLLIQGEKSPTRILDIRHILVSILPSAHPAFPVSVSSSPSFPISLHTADTQLRQPRFSIPLGHSPSPYPRSSSLATQFAACHAASFCLLLFPSYPCSRNFEPHPIKDT